MTGLKHWLVFLLILLPLGTGAAAEEAKPLRGVALIIGQSNYTNIASLLNAGADARAIGKMMTDLGFETRNAPDRNAKALKREIDRFIEDAEGADVAFVYYAGHGIEAAGENWLVPVDADLSSLDNARERLVSASGIIERLKQVAPVAIFLLDACRNSPFPPDALLKPEPRSAGKPIVVTGLMPSRGMTLVENQPVPLENVGVVMGFAAEPGRAALDGPKDGNSPYAAALLRHFSAAGGATFGDVMTMVTEEVYLATGARQRPWVNASLRRLLYFGMAPAEDDKDAARITDERRKLLLTISTLPITGRRQVEAIAKSDQVPLASLFGMLRAIGAATPKDPAELDKVLRAQAERLKSVLAESMALKNSDAEIIRLSSLADRAVAEGAIETAVFYREAAKKRAASVSSALDQTEAALAARRLELAEVYAKSGETYVLAFDHRAAADDFLKASAEAERWNAGKALGYRLAAAEALKLDGQYKGNKESLEKAVAAYELASREITEASDPQRWLKTQADLASALQILGERETDVEKLRRGAAILEALLTRKELLTGRFSRSEILTRLALILSRLGEREVGTVSLLKAARTFEAALAELPWLNASFARASIQGNLGAVLMNAGQRERGTQNLDRAIAVFENALRGLSARETPVNWAVTQSNLGLALRFKGERESSSQTLKQSIAAFQAALTVFRRKDTPYNWALANANLGMALWRLGERDVDKGNLLAALTALSSAAEELTRERSPADWAGLQASRGLVLLQLGERETGNERLKEAVSAFEQALQIYRRDVSPIRWAESQNNLGTALLSLGRREPDGASLGLAVSAFEAVLTVVTRERQPLDWAVINNNLGVALTELGERRPDDAILRRAVSVLRETMTEMTPGRVPLRWAGAQGTLGKALFLVGRRETGLASLLEAVTAFEEASTEMTRERVPRDWAVMQKNFARVHLLLGQRKGDRKEVQLARAMTSAAWEALKSGGDTSKDAELHALLEEIDAALKELP